MLGLTLHHLIAPPFSSPNHQHLWKKVQFWNAMELNYSPTTTTTTTTAATAFFLLFLLLSTPPFSRGELDVSDKNPEVYEIDYRGPETHSHIPPPNRSGGLPFIRGENPRGHRKSKGLRGGRIGENAKQTHG